MGKIDAISVLVVLLGITGADAAIVELPLACEGKYTLEQTWTTDFDIGVTFTEISNIYIDWSGSIRAEFVEDLVTSDRFPMDAQFIADLYDLVTHDFCGRASLRTGAATYPNPEPFDLQSTFSNGGWSMLLDGQGTIEIGFWGVVRPGTYITIEEPIGQLNSATLIFEETLDPEPATLFLLAFGAVMMKKKR